MRYLYGMAILKSFLGGLIMYAIICMFIHETTKQTVTLNLDLENFGYRKPVPDKKQYILN